MQSYSRACFCGEFGLTKATKIGAQGPTGTAPQREKHKQNEGKDPISLKREHPALNEADTHASEGVSFEELHERVGVLEQTALGELETALEAISDYREIVAQPSAGTDEFPSAERTLWRDLANFPDLFLMRIGADGRAKFVNDSMLKSLGYEAEEVAGGDVARMLFPESEQKKVASIFSSLLVTGQPFSFETQMHSKIQGVFSVHWQMKLIRSRDENQEYLLCIGMRRAQPMGQIHRGSGLHEIRSSERAIEKKPLKDEVLAKKPSHNGFHSLWAYVVIYLLTSLAICFLGALSGPKAVYYNGWLVLLRLTGGLHQMDVPDHDFMFGQAFLGDYALMVGAAIFFIFPGLVAIALVNAARSFKR